MAPPGLGLGSCRARLQAGILGANRCPPEGVRYRSLPSLSSQSDYSGKGQEKCIPARNIQQNHPNPRENVLISFPNAEDSSSQRNIPDCYEKKYELDRVVHKP
jgi:hypothetical protein